MPIHSICQARISREELSKIYRCIILWLYPGQLSKEAYELAVNEIRTIRIASICRRFHSFHGITYGQFEAMNSTNYQIYEGEPDGNQ